MKIRVLLIIIVASILVYSQIRFYESMKNIKKATGATKQTNVLIAQETLNQKIDSLKEEVIILKQQLNEIRDLLELVEDDLLYLRREKLLPQGFMGAVFGDMPGGKGVLVEKVLAGYPAKQAGLEEGDIILSFGGYGVFSRQALSFRIKRTRPGTQVEIEISRRREQKVLVITLASKPK